MSSRRPFGPVGIIDIGSNSVRLVAYGGSERVPSMLFNEKVMAGLGRGLAKNGRLEEKAMARALEALARFRLLRRQSRPGRAGKVTTRSPVRLPVEFRPVCSLEDGPAKPVCGGRVRPDGRFCKLCGQAQRLSSATPEGPGT